MPTLNVILHGLVALHELPDQIIALLPSLPGIHVQRAGTWLAEQDLQPRTDYKLTGVSINGQGRFDPARNLILGNVALVPNPGVNLHAVIAFPRPSNIFSLRLVDIAQGDFGGANAGLVTNTKMATLQIFQYECDQISKVKLENHTWRPPTLAGITSANLHIFSEEEVIGIGEDHAIDAFAKAVSLFRNIDLTLVNSSPVPNFNAATDQPPAGVAPIELENLAHRQPRLAMTGQSLLRTPPDTVGMVAAWQPFIPAAGSVRTCSFLIARGV